MRKLSIYIILTLLGIAVAQAAPNDHLARAVVRAKLDTVQATMGEHVLLHVEVLKDSHNGAMFNLPRAEKNRPMSLGSAEVRNITVDSTTLGNGRVQLDYTFQLQPFEVGVCVIPPFKYVIGTDTFASDIVTLKVEEPPMPQEMRDSLLINPMEGTVQINARWYDYIPDWVYWTLGGILAFLVIGGGITALIFYLVYRKTGRIPFMAPPKTPPYELAMKQLKELKSRKLAETGHEKEYYTLLTDILREYLEGRFNIYAREMTSGQILEAMQANADTAAYAPELRPMLETADFVKFAKVRPLQDENIRAFGTVHNFVESTKPVEQPTETKKK